MFTQLCRLMYLVVNCCQSTSFSQLVWKSQIPTLSGWGPVTMQASLVHLECIKILASCNDV